MTDEILENFIKYRHKILKNSWQISLQELQLFCNCKKIIIGCELEFYLLDSNLESVSLNAVNDFIHQFKKNDLLSSICEVKKERGKSQIEIATIPYDDLIKLSNDLDFIKKIINQIAKNFNLFACFKGHVFDSDCGNSLQFNISLIDSQNKNILFQDPKLLNLFSSLLLDYSDKIIYLLAPNCDDYKRFDTEINKKLFDLGKFCAPTNLSFGNDNRSCAIRIPSCDNKENTRIEYRIASASTNHYLSLSAILLILAQIKTQKKIYPQIFGNAFDEIYNLKNFTKDYQHAKENFFNKKNIIFNYFNDIIKF